MSLVAPTFGLDGEVAARADRFLPMALRQVRSKHGCSGTKLVSKIVAELTADLDVKEWMQTLLADINNQGEGAERMIDRSCIFKWADQHLPDTSVADSSSSSSEDDSDEADEDQNESSGKVSLEAELPKVGKHDVFYNAARAQEFADLDPKEPSPKHKYEPFVSPLVLAAMLRAAKFLMPKQ